MNSMSTLMNAFFSNVNHYHAQLPYNLSWQIRPKGALLSYLESHSIRVMDVGARGGSVPELNPLEALVDYVAFDADDKEALRLSSGTHPYARYRIFPHFIGEAEGNIPFYLYQSPGESSCLEPNIRYQSEFDPSFKIRETVTVNTQALDDVLNRESLAAPDFLKIDVQGMTLSVLKGAEQNLGTIPLIEVESEFYRMYEGQSLFYETGQYLDQKGYVLLYMNRVFSSRSVYDGDSRGQILFFDALFGLDVVSAGKLPVDSLIKYTILLIQYGHRDFASELIRTYPVIGETIENIADFLPQSSTSLLGKVVRRLWMQVDKVIAFLLFARKTNHLHHDSDRSWPIR